MYFFFDFSLFISDCAGIFLTALTFSLVVVCVIESMGSWTLRFQELRVPGSRAERGSCGSQNLGAGAGVAGPAIEPQAQ